MRWYSKASLIRRHLNYSRPGGLVGFEKRQAQTGEGGEMRQCDACKKEDVDIHRSRGTTRDYDLCDECSAKVGDYSDEASRRTTTIYHQLLKRFVDRMASGYGKGAK